MLGLTDIRKGKMIVLDGEPYVITSAEFLRKQQRRPVVRSIVRNIRTNKTREHTFQQSDKVAEADVTRKPFQFLYHNEDAWSFMDNGTYEQVELSADIVGDMGKFLIEGQEAVIVMFEGLPVGIELPIKIDRKVIEAAPGVRGDTSSNVTKDVVVEGSVTVKAPLFIKEGDTIRIDTRSGEYVERA